MRREQINVRSARALTDAQAAQAAGGTDFRTPEQIYEHHLYIIPSEEEMRRRFLIGIE